MELKSAARWNRFPWVPLDYFTRCGDKYQGDAQGNPKGGGCCKARPRLSRRLKGVYIPKTMILVPLKIFFLLNIFCFQEVFGDRLITNKYPSDVPHLSI